MEILKEMFPSFTGDNTAIQYASERGHLDIVKYLGSLGGSS